MKGQSIFPWESYGLIAELALKLKDRRPQFSKTALQKLIYLLQEIYGIDCGYRFDFYIFGPYCSDIELDLSLVASWDGVRIEPVASYLGGYHIAPGDNNQAVREKAKDFLTRDDVSSAIEGLVNEFGSLSAKELELISTIIYVVREETVTSMVKLLSIVKSLKPRFSEEEILNKIHMLQSRGLITLGE